MLAADGALGSLLPQFLGALMAHAHVAAGQHSRVALVHQADNTQTLLLLLRCQTLCLPAPLHVSHAGIRDVGLSDEAAFWPLASALCCPPLHVKDVGTAIIWPGVEI